MPHSSSILTSHSDITQPTKALLQKPRIPETNAGRFKTKQDKQAKKQETHRNLGGDSLLDLTNKGISLLLLKKVFRRALLGKYLLGHNAARY